MMMMMMLLMTIGDDDVAQAIANGEFIEHATFAGNTYGTSTLAVERVRDKGDPEMNIDINLHFHIYTFASIHPQHETSEEISFIVPHIYGSGSPGREFCSKCGTFL